MCKDTEVYYCRYSTITAVWSNIKGYDRCQAEIWLQKQFVTNLRTPTKQKKTPFMLEFSTELFILSFLILPCCQICMQDKSGL